MAPERITPEHLVAFAHHLEAMEALQAVCDVAADAVAERWKPTEPMHRGDDWIWGYTAPDGGETLHGWKITWRRFDNSDKATLPDGRRGVPRFVAGLNAPAGALSSLDPAAREQLRRAGFTLLPAVDLRWKDHDYIVMTAYPDELLAGKSIQEQGTALGQWVLDTFKLATRALADRDASE